MESHETLALFDREGRPWPEPSTEHVEVRMRFFLDTSEMTYQATAVILDGTNGLDLEWTTMQLEYGHAAWAQAMTWVAWQLERARHHLETFP